MLQGNKTIDQGNGGSSATDTSPAVNGKFSLFLFAEWIIFYYIITCIVNELLELFHGTTYWSLPVRPSLEMIMIDKRLLLVRCNSNLSFSNILAHFFLSNKRDIQITKIEILLTRVILDTVSICSTNFVAKSDDTTDLFFPDHSPESFYRIWLWALSRNNMTLIIIVRILIEWRFNVVSIDVCIIFSFTFSLRKFNSCLHNWMHIRVDIILLVIYIHGFCVFVAHVIYVIKLCINQWLLNIGKNT